MSVHIDSEEMLKPCPEKKHVVAKSLPFTVVLLTPDYLAGQYGEEWSTNHVFAQERIEAIRTARQNTQIALDALDCDEDDFAVVFVCHGHQANIAP